jgi:hypothetical protein
VILTIYARIFLCAQNACEKYNKFTPKAKRKIDFFAAPKVGEKAIDNGWEMVIMTNDNGKDLSRDRGRAEYGGVSLVSQ